MGKSCVIVGTGHAAASLGPALRQAGWGDSITIAGEEPHLPYHRPPLSKEFLAGKRTLDEILIRPNEVYPTNGRSFAAFNLKDGALIAVDAINRPPEFMGSKKLISATRGSMQPGSPMCRCPCGSSRAVEPDDGVRLHSVAVPLSVRVHDRLPHYLPGGDQRTGN